MKMNMIVCVATRCNVDRMDRFMESLLRTDMNGEPRETIGLKVVNTGEASDRLAYLVSQWPFSTLINLGDRPRRYAEIMKEKIEAAIPFAHDNTVYWNWDDDYQVNPYWYRYVMTLFEENSQIDYLTLFKGNPGYDYPKLMMSGWPLTLTGSTLGGCFGARWTTFYPQVLAFFEKYGITGMFDQEFWQFLTNTTGRPHNIYMPLDVSLAQHCNLISHYLEEKPGCSKLAHHYAFDYDPICNPFALRVKD